MVHRIHRVHRRIYQLNNPIHRMHFVVVIVNFLQWIQAMWKNIKHGNMPIIHRIFYPLILMILINNQWLIINENESIVRKQVIVKKKVQLYDDREFPCQHNDNWRLIPLQQRSIMTMIQHHRVSFPLIDRWSSWILFSIRSSLAEWTVFIRYSTFHNKN